MKRFWLWLVLTLKLLFECGLILFLAILAVDVWRSSIDLFAKVAATVVFLVWNIILGYGIATDLFQD